MCLMRPDGALSWLLRHPGKLLPLLLAHSLLGLSLLSQLQQIPLQRLKAGERRPLSAATSQLSGRGGLELLARKGQPECRRCKASQAAGRSEADHGLHQLGDGARHYHCLHYLRCLPLVLEPE